MANIPVERERSGGGWWKWLLGVVAIVLAAWVIWAVVSPGEDDEFAAGDQLMQQDAEYNDPAAGLITDASTITQTQDPSQLVGREVHLTNMRVERVQGDSVLFVSDPGMATQGDQGMVTPEDDGMQMPRDEGMQAQPGDDMQTQPGADMQDQPDEGAQMQSEDGMQTQRQDEMQAEQRIIVAGLNNGSPAQQDGMQQDGMQQDGMQQDGMQQDDTQIEEGQTVTVIGSIEQIQQGQTDEWGITAQEGDQLMAEREVYVRARNVQVNDGAQARPAPATGL